MKKPLRRIAALLLAACCFFSFFGCASAKDIVSAMIKIIKSNNSEETTSAETDAPETTLTVDIDTTSAETATPINSPDAPDDEEPDVNRDSVFLQYICPAVFALSFTNYSVVEYYPLSDPYTLWEALGWYTGYLYMADGTVELSKDTIGILTKLFTGSDEFIDCPDDYIDGGYIEKRVATYSFPGFCYSMEDYFGDEGTMQFAIETDGYAVYSHIFEILDGEGIYTADYEWFFEESGDNPPYTLINYTLPSLEDDYYESEYYLASADELQEYVDINNMQRICFADGNRLYIDYSESSVNYEDMPEGGAGYYQEAYFERRNGWLAVSFLSTDLYEGEYWSGYYRGCSYWHDYEYDRMLCTIEAATEAPEWQYDNVLNFYLSEPLEAGIDVWAIYTDHETLELSYFTEYEDAEYTNYVIIELDAESKLIQFIKTYSVFSPGTEVESQYFTELTCYYNDELDEEFVTYFTKYFNELDNNTREVTVNYVSADDSFKETYKIPKTWEFLPYGFIPEQVYSNEGLTKRYEYPGDNKNYEIWASYGVG